MFDIVERLRIFMDLYRLDQIEVEGITGIPQGNLDEILTNSRDPTTHETKSIWSALTIIESFLIATKEYINGL